MSTLEGRGRSGLSAAPSVMRTPLTAAILCMLFLASAIAAGEDGIGLVDIEGGNAPPRHSKVPGLMDRGFAQRRERAGIPITVTNLSITSCAGRRPGRPLDFGERPALVWGNTRDPGAGAGADPAGHGFVLQGLEADDPLRHFGSPTTPCLRTSSTPIAPELEQRTVIYLDDNRS